MNNLLSSAHGLVESLEQSTDSADALDQCILVGGRESPSEVDGAAGVALGEARLGDRSGDRR